MRDIVKEREERLAAAPFVVMSPPVGFFKGSWASWREIITHRQLLFLMTQREIKAKYKNSALGLLWSLARPLVSLLIYYLVIGQFLGAARGLPNFAIYVFAGLTTWGLFSEIVNGGTQSIINNNGIIKKTKLPREVFPMAAAGSALFNLCVQLVILALGVALVGGINQNLKGFDWLYLPASLLLITVWGLALGILLSAVNVYLRDMQFLVEVLLQIGFWMSPVVYSWKMVSDWGNGNGWLGTIVANIYLANPVTLGVLGFRRFVWNDQGTAPDPTHLGIRILIVLVLGLVALFAAQRAFDRLQRNFAQEM